MESKDYLQQTVEALDLRCPFCSTGKGMQISKHHEFTYKGKLVAVDYPTIECQDCKTRWQTEELMQQSLDLIHKKYNDEYPTTGEKVQGVPEDEEKEG